MHICAQIHTVSSPSLKVNASTIHESIGLRSVHYLQFSHFQQPGYQHDSCQYMSLQMEVIVGMSSLQSFEENEGHIDLERHPQSKVYRSSRAYLLLESKKNLWDSS